MFMISFHCILGECVVDEDVLSEFRLLTTECYM